MLRQLTPRRLAVAGLATAMLAAAPAVAQERTVPPVREGTANVLVPPGALAPKASQDAAKDPTANVLVPPSALASKASEDAAKGRTANVLVPPTSLASAASQDAARSRTADVFVPPAPISNAKPAASADDGLDAGLVIALASLAVIAVAGAGCVYLVRVRSPRSAAA